MESLGARTGGPEKPPSQLCDTVMPLVFSILQDGLDMRHQEGFSPLVSRRGFCAEGISLVSPLD